MAELFAGRYELVDALGQGAAGSVWRAWDHKRQEYSAAKVLRHVDAMSMLRFVREQSYRIDHRHVVVPAGWAGEGDRVLFTMPMIRGGSAGNLLDDYSMVPPEWVAVLLDQLLDALVAVHALGIVHRDLKPSNLLLEPTGTARPHLWLSDVGITAQLGLPRLTKVGAFVGTPGYLAPEQTRGAPPDPRQDLFACGAVAADLLRGRSPVDEDGVPSPLEREAPLGIPSPLWAVLRWLAAPDADDRPLNAGEVRNELARSGCVPDAQAWNAEVESTGAAVAVADQTPLYPPDWGPDGPLGESSLRAGSSVDGGSLFLRRPSVTHQTSQTRQVPEAAETTETDQVSEAPEITGVEPASVFASEPEPEPEPEWEPESQLPEPEPEWETEPEWPAEPEPAQPEPGPEISPGPEAGRGRRLGVGGFDEVVEAATRTGEIPVVREEAERQAPWAPRPEPGPGPGMPPVQPPPDSEGERTPREQPPREQPPREQPPRERPPQEEQRLRERAAREQPPDRLPREQPSREQPSREQASREQPAPGRTPQPRSRETRPQARTPRAAGPQERAPQQRARQQGERQERRGAATGPVSGGQDRGAPPVWATGGPPPAPVRRRRSGRVLRAIAITATVLGSVLLLAAAALLILR